MATRQAQSRQSYGGSQLALENNPHLLAVPAGGTSGQVLAKTSGTDYATGWTTPASGGGGLTPTASKTSAYTAVKGDLVLANANGAAFTVTLPASPASGDIVGVKKTDSSANLVTVVGSGVTTIDGDPNTTLTVQDAAATFVFDGTNWQISSTAVLSSAAAAAAASTSDGYFAPAYTSGWWYDRRSGTAQANLGSSSAVSWTPSTILYLPAYLHKSVQVNAVAVAQQTAANTGGVVRLGVYKPDATNGNPGTLITDLGTQVSTGSATLVTWTPGSAFTLPKGFVWWALSFSSATAGTFLGFTNANPSLPPTQGQPNASFTYANAQLSGSICNLTATGDAAASALAANPTVTATWLQAALHNVYYKIA